MIRLNISGEKGERLAEGAMAELRDRAPGPMTAAVAVLVETARSLVSRPGGAGTASAPGEPPLLQTGELAKSIKGRRIKVWRKGFKRRLSWGSNLPQAAALEWGYTTQSGKRVFPRPFMAVAERKAEAAVDAILNEI